MTHRKGRALVASMVAALVAVGGLAYWDDARESQAALDDFADEQATLASSVAVDLSARLASLQRAGTLLAELAGQPGVAPRTSFGGLYRVRIKAKSEPASGAPAEGDGLVLQIPLADGREVEFVAPASAVLLGLERIERSRALLVLVRPPRLRQLHRPDGSALADEELIAALDRGDRVLRIPREAAPRFGLPQRLAVAGLDHADTASLGRWGVAVVATAERSRDRDRRARFRLLLTVLVAAGLVFAFGGLALREQRRELKLARELALRERDERLDREAKAATMVTLATGVAHEIATPLGVIVARAEQLVERATEGDRTAHGARVILEQASSIHGVMRGFLTLARGQNPQLGAEKPSQIAQGAASLVEHRFAKAGVALQLAVSDELPRVRGDQRLLEHALVNLLLNACDASEAGSTVRLWAEAKAGSLTFVVDDEGQGISPEVARRAAEPFFSTKSVERGTGLGLAIATEIVKSHRGTLELGPREGRRGTTARVSIPLAQAEVAGG